MAKLECDICKKRTEMKEMEFSKDGINLLCPECQLEDLFNNLTKEQP